LIINQIVAKFLTKHFRYHRWDRTGSCRYTGADWNNACQSRISSLEWKCRNTTL